LTGYLVAEVVAASEEILAIGIYFATASLSTAWLGSKAARGFTVIRMMEAATRLITPHDNQYKVGLYVNNFIPKPGPMMRASDQVIAETPR
jgi:hypothetical protein